MARRLRIGRFALSIRSAKRGRTHPDIRKVQKFLTRFGYLTSTIEPGKLDTATSKAIATYQSCMGLKDTGELTAATVRAIEAPRCGTPDVDLIAARASASRTDESTAGSFVLRGCSYSKLNFTYRFVNGTGDIAGDNERQAVRNAFATWQNALCGVTFTERASGAVDFLIGWFTGDHGDGSAFDGVGNTLAHAFYPPPCGGSHAGKMHFDDAETWSLTGAGSTFDTETVALHEIGHLLGLAHSSVAGAVMFPSYGGVRRALSQDDRDGVRRLYPFLCRRGDSGSQAGFVSEIAAVRHRTRQVITATRTQAGTLKLIAWQVAANGGVTRTGDSGDQAGAATSIAIARNTTGSRYVTACRTAAGTLRLISWDVNAAGTSLTRRGDSANLAGAATLVNLVAVDDGLFVSAVRAGNGRLLLISWRLNANGSFTRLADSGNAAGAVSDIAMARLSSDRVVTAVRTSDGTLKVISWRVTAAGAITRLGDSGNQAGAATQIKVALDGFGNPVTAVRDASGDLKLITWRIAANGAVTRRGDSGDLAGDTGGHDIAFASNFVVTGVRTGSGTLKVILWSTTSGGAVSRVGDSGFLAGSASLITVNEGLTGAPPIVTSVRTQSNDLKLITWSHG